MTRRPVMVLMVLASMLMAGCLGYFENQEEEQNFDWITPELLLGNRMRSSPALNHYDGCAELEEDLRNSMIEEMMVGLDQASYWHWNSWGFRGGMMVDDMVMEMDGDMAMPETTGSDSSNSMDSSSPPSTSGAGDREGQYSETNNQEEGVDEADFLKTDGYHIYMINNGQLVILGVPEFGNITLESNMTLEGSPMQMLVSGDQLVIISSVSYWDLEIDDPVRIAMMVDNSEDEREYSYYRYSNKVKYSVLNITNRSDPQIDRELYLDGSYQTSRLVDGTLRAVTHSYAQLQGLQTYPDLPESYWEIDYDDPERQDIWNESVDEAVAYNIGVISALTLADFSPRMHERMADGTVAELSTVSATCEEFSAAADSVGRGFTTIMTIELFGDIIEYELDHVSSSWVEVYASQDMLILAEPANDWWWYWRNDDFE
ncbi:MAG TPA: beta-propeller domain-containing protein, partial [Candidatus Thalassarchaeaceae archaeon]|nr:beta-propeller domain-containing protein [Candidatus Thalassarchaeaceae archaeon]